MRKYRSTFFDEPKEESLIKLRILQKYLVPWSAKVGSASVGKTIWVVDGFAGPGTYENVEGTPGSPRRILDQARKVAIQNRPFRIACLFVEKNRRHWETLRALCSTYSEVVTHVLEGDFWSQVDEIALTVAGQPMFLVIDPFGIKGLDYRKLASLANSSQKCDLVVTFVTGAVPRLESQYRDDIELAIGPAGPNDASAAETFARNMAEAAGFLPGGRFAITQSLDIAAAYELIVFSRSYHAYKLWNDFVTNEWIEVARLKPKEAMKPLMLGFEDAFAQADATDERNEAANDILEWARGRQRFTRRELIEEFVVWRFGDYHTRTLNQALTILEAEGRIASADRKRNDSTVWNIVNRQGL
jgi:three-Cys-motif partner protein